MQFQPRRHHHARRLVRRHASAFLLLAACPRLAFAQSPGTTPALTADTDAGANAAAAPAATAGGGGSSGGFFEEPHVITRGVNWGARVFGDGSPHMKNGFYPEMSNMTTGSGVISVGPGYRHTMFGGAGFVDMSAALSWHAYKIAQGRIEFPDLENGHFTFGAQTMWQDATQMNYYGLGSDVVVSDQSQYRLKTTDVVGYASARPAHWFTIGAEIGYLHRPEVLSPSGSFKPSLPTSQELYPNDPGMSDAYQPSFLHSELSLTSDTRDYPGYPSKGGVYRAALTTYTDRSTGLYNFDQYEIEAAHFVPFDDERIVFAVHAWTVFSDVGSGHQMPFYLTPSLGGSNTLRAYDSLQFHDQNLALLSGELRFAVYTHMDFGAFYDAGNVAASYNDLNFDKRTIGVGLRLHTERATFARFDVAHGSQGWHFVVRTTDPFKFSRVTRKLARAPFAP